MVKNFLVGSGTTYTLSIVDTSGRVASTTARKRSDGNLSTSATTVYHL
ncbi:MAG TPA: hypothetical protein VNU19_03455 [Candidatus Acidoferrum sp.]|nr:hypothetical protein [Candidatus Acidoferrum sp.]